MGPVIDATKIIEDYRRFFASFWPGIFRISAKNLPLLSLRPSLTVGMTKIPKIPGLFHYFFCWNLRNLPAESTSEMLASFTDGVFKSIWCFFCVLLGRQGSRSCGYFNAKMRGSRRTAKSDRSKPALVIARDRRIPPPPSQAGVGFGLWLGSPVWFCSSIGRHETKLRRKQGPTGGGVTKDNRPARGGLMQPACKLRCELRVSCV